MEFFMTLESGQAETLVRTLCDQLNETKLYLDAITRERDKYKAEALQLKAELKEAKNLAEAATLAQTEKEEL